MPCKARDIFINAAEGRHRSSLPLKEGGAERRKIECLAEAQFSSTTQNANDVSTRRDSSLSQEIMRLRRILSSASYGGTFFQKKAFSSDGLVQTNRSLRNVVTRGDCECHAKLGRIL